MARKPPKVEKDTVPVTNREPTPEERDELTRALTNMQLHGCHPLIATNVKDEVANLLALCGRPDLAVEWRTLL